MLRAQLQMVGFISKTLNSYSSLCRFGESIDHFHFSFATNEDEAGNHVTSWVTPRAEMIFTSLMEHTTNNLKIKNTVTGEILYYEDVQLDDVFDAINIFVQAELNGRSKLGAFQLGEGTLQ